MSLDPKSESLLAGVDPILAQRARLVLAALIAKGIDARIISGLRTYAEQGALFAKHDGTTHARGGQSNHNFGLACDIGIFVNGKYLQDGPQYNLIQAEAHAARLESGADWKHINDRPHIQLKSDLIINGSPTNECRKLFQTGGLPAVYAHVNATVGLGTTTPPAPAPATDADVHVVVSGDTLSGLAQKFGTTVDALKQLNGLSSDVIQIGQKIRLK
jgi:LysM repeat protein